MTADTDTLWEEMPPPADLPAAETPPDKEETAPICPVCDQPIIRDPSWKRMRKYHPECAAAGAKAATGTGGRKGTSKAEKEADECSRILQAGLMKAALAVSVVDRFDAFCIMVNASSVCSSWRAVCLRYPDLRKEFLRIPEGGSVFSLIFAVLFMAAPMAAHHGLIPQKRIADLLTNLPIALFKLHERMKEGEAGLTVLMREHMEAMAETRDARRESNGQYVGPSRSPGQ